MTSKVAVLLFIPYILSASAGNVYVTPTGGSTGSCPAGSTTFTASQFNSPTNWGAGSMQIGPGTNVLVCGTFTFSSGGSGLIPQGSGTSGNPIIITLESGAILQAPYFGAPSGLAAGCSGSCPAGISIVEQNYITVDGQNSGLIQDTDNGTLKTNHQSSAGLFASGDHILIKRLVIDHIYDQVNNGSNDTAGINTVGIFIDSGSTNVEICGSTSNHAHTGIQVFASHGVSVDGPDLCNGTQAATGVNIHHNTLNQHVWHIEVNSVGRLNVYSNELQTYTDWNTSNDFYHLDGIIVFSGSAGQALPYIYNNYAHGDMGANGTGTIFCTYGVAGTGSACTIFNNILVGEGTSQGSVCCQAGEWHHSADGHSLGPHFTYNNTFVGFSRQYFQDGDSSQVYTVENNVFDSLDASNTYYINGVSTPLANVTSDYNVFYNGRTAGPLVLQSTFYVFATWQSAGKDIHGAQQNPTLDSSYHLQGGSPAIGIGINLSSNCLANGGDIPNALCADKASIPRPASGPWDIGAYQYTVPGNAFFSGAVTTSGQVLH